MLKSKKKKKNHCKCYFTCLLILCYKIVPLAFLVMFYDLVMNFQTKKVRREWLIAMCDVLYMIFFSLVFNTFEILHSVHKLVLMRLTAFDACHITFCLL